MEAHNNLQMLSIYISIYLLVASITVVSGNHQTRQLEEDTNLVNEEITEIPINENDPNPINKYCTCTKSSCKCCRDIVLPLITVRDTGCATVKYLDNDKISVTIKYGDLVLASRTITGAKATPICVPLPGGFSRFCGRVYGISRRDENFQACLGLELRAEDEVEAALRVSCFQFGPKGLAVTDAEPLPVVQNEDEDDEDDEDDDILGIDGDDGDSDSDDDGGGVADILGRLASYYSE